MSQFYTSTFRLSALLLLALIGLTPRAFAQNGITWDAPMDVATNTYSNLHPRIALDAAGDARVLWGRANDESAFISRWTGSAFSMPMKVNANGMTIATQSWMGPDVAAQGDTLYVVMKRTPEASDTNHVYIRRSLDGGMTFGAAVQVDNIGDSISRFPTLTVDAQGNPIVAFMKFDPSFMDARWVVSKSTDAGMSFSLDQKASGWSGGTVCDCCPGAITMSGNTVCMAYRDNLNNIRDTWVGISSNAGATFTQGMPVDGGNWMLMNCPSSGPDMYILGDTVWTVFMSQSSGLARVYQSKASLTAATGTTGTTLNPGIAVGIDQENFPRIAGKGEAAAIVWRQSNNGMGELPILFTNNLANGFPASAEIVAFGGGSAVVNVDVAVSADAVHVVWQDNSTGTVRYRKGSFTPFVGIASQDVHPGFALAPNPAASMVSLSIVGTDWQGCSINITDLQGRVVAEFQPTAQTLDMDVTSWKAGVYCLQLQSPSGTVSKKLVVFPR